MIALDNNKNGMNYFSSLFGKRELAFDPEKDYVQWKSSTQEQLGKILGLDRMKKADPDPREIQKENMGTYDREKVVITTQKNLDMPMYVLRPHEGNGIPVLAIHGHGCNGKDGLVGIHYTEIEKNMKKFSYTYALDMVEKGYTVYVPDLLGSGERRIDTSDPLKSECYDMNNVCMSLGISLLGIHIFDMMCLIDYILENSDDKRLILMGFSGGGIASLMISAFCEKAYITVVSGFFHGFEDTMLTSNFCGCNFVYKLWEKIDMGDMAALVAPRYLFVETGRNDRLNGVSGLENVYPQVDIAKKAYELMGSNNFEFRIFENAHQWYGGCYDFIDNIIKNKA